MAYWVWYSMEQTHPTDILWERWLSDGVRNPAFALWNCSGWIGVCMHVVKRQLEPNRLDIILSGSPSMPDLENLCLTMLREAAGLRHGFAVFVDTTSLQIDDPSMLPILSKVFRSLQWFGISRIEHRGAARHLDSEVQTFYGSTGLLGIVPLQIDPF